MKHNNPSVTVEEIAQQLSEFERNHHTMLEVTQKRYTNLRQCRSCKYDRNGNSCTVLLNDLQAAAGAFEWMGEQEWRNGYPRADADGCPGWRLR
ncbi:MAG: hypothetical protein ACW987_20050 [Candidatus Thorarchaeota archaeon]|jgi:hypothetical protein